MTELKLCPFCGGEAIMETFTTKAENVPRYRVRCCACFCQTDWDNFSVEDAKNVWNRRREDG